VTPSKRRFVFLHGAWHNGGTWRYLDRGIGGKWMLRGTRFCPEPGQFKCAGRSAIVRLILPLRNEPSPNAGGKPRARHQALSLDHGT